MPQRRIFDGQRREVACLGPLEPLHQHCNLKTLNRKRRPFRNKLPPRGFKRKRDSQSAVTPSDSEPPASRGGDAQPPATLSKTDVADATREDVLKRIDATFPSSRPKKKKRLGGKIGESLVRWNESVVIRFLIRIKTALSRAATDDMMKRLGWKEM